MQTDHVVYCEHCGATPGAATKCPILEFRGQHLMTKSDEPVVCQACGKSPGVAERCPVSDFGGAHNFVKISRL